MSEATPDLDADARARHLCEWEKAREREATRRGVIHGKVAVELATHVERLLAERDQLAARVAELTTGLETIQELADDELRRLGAVPGSNVAQIEANANALLKGEKP